MKTLPLSKPQNRMPPDWTKMLDDEVLATAILDRLLFRCEVIILTEKSYRMENGKPYLIANKGDILF